jgi:5-methylcytosine-specific restriction endonuclease McrA
MSDNDNELKELEDYQKQDEEDTFDKNTSKKIVWLPMNFTIQGIHNMKKDGDLDPSPRWQREYVFDKIKASRLIESVLLGVPLPAVYLAEEADGTMSVIDGQQRLSTFFFFLDNQFPVKGEPKKCTDFTLSGLQILPELNKKSFSDLDKTMQLKIKNTPLHIITIKNDSAEDVKFDIFERLNTGSMKLNEDEIRNSVYRGPYIDLLDELAENKVFNDLVRKPNFKNRMLYRGMILRFFALSEKTYLNYRPSMKQFCNKELLEHRNLSKNKADEYRKRFSKSVELCRSVFGENAFRRFNPGKSEADRNGSWVVSRINMALFDVQMCGFAMYDQSKLQGHWDEIREAMLNLVCNDKEYSDAIELKTSGTEQMRVRFKKWLDTLDFIISGTPPSPRVFPYAIKKQLFDADPTCKLCKNQIMAIEDAEVDHITPYSQGGPTTLDNAQITHRYCNRHKSDNTA